MSPAGVRLAAGFAEAERRAVAALYWEAFGSKLALALGPDGRAIGFIADILDPRFAIVARAPTGRVLGVAGLRTTEGAMIGGGWGDYVRHYGRAGACWRALLLSALERAALPGTLQADGIAVARAARGQGLGRRLLDALAAEARARGLGALQLDVVEDNIRARALYERSGFVAIGEQRMGPLAPLLGFRRATTMRVTLA